MVQTRKFSQFQGPSPIQSGDIVVGLRTVDGRYVNYQFTGVGSGGGGSSGGIVQVITQDNTFQGGEWVRMDASGNYVPAQADTAQHAEIAGLVLITNLSPTQFTLQIIGYVDDTSFVAKYGGQFQPGQVWFLSDTNQGEMTLNEPTTNGFVSIPVFISTGTDGKGWIRHWRGFILGGQPSPSGGGGGSNPNIVVINQANTFNLGDVVYIDGAGIYQLSTAVNLASSQAVGVVIATGNPFTLQTEGYNSNAIKTDAAGADLVPGGVYYVSDNPLTPGRVTLVAPTTVGHATKPIFICESAGPGFSTGYIMPQRPLEVTAASSSPPNIYQVNQPVQVTDPVHGGPRNFNVGEWLYIAPYGGGQVNYTLAEANSLNQAQAVGVVIAAGNPVFTIQTEGYNQGAVTLDEAGMPIASGTIYYITGTHANAGKITSIPPAGVAQYNKPVFVCEQTFANNGIYAGVILPQRPLLSSVVAGGGGGGGGGAGVGATIQSRFTQTTATFGVVNTGAGALNPASYTTLPGYSLSITPGFVTSAIRARFVIFGTLNGASFCAFRVIRNGVPIASSLAIDGTNGHFNGSTVNNRSGPHFVIELQDVPGVIAAYNYQLQAQVYGGMAGTQYLFNVENTGGFSKYGRSTIVLEEIA